MRNIKIDEHQDKEIKKLVKESLDPNGGKLSLHYNTNTTPKTPGEIGTAIVDASKAADKIPANGAIENSVTISADPDHDNRKQDITVNGDNIAESVIISKGQLDEIRLKNLKEHSEVVKIKDFLK